jgi:uncharacterized membrane protein
LNLTYNGNSVFVVETFEKTRYLCDYGRHFPRICLVWHNSVWLGSYLWFLNVFNLHVVVRDLLTYYGLRWTPSSCFACPM